MRYPPGTDHFWHVDRNSQDVPSLNRTVSFSLLLSTPGVDFTGPDFQTNSGVADLRCSDMVAFTSKTRHSVTTIESGVRLVLICFGSYLP